MHIRCGYEIAYWSNDYTPMMLLLSVHPSRGGDLLDAGVIDFSPLTSVTHHVDMFGNTRMRLIAPPGELAIRTDFTIRDTGMPDDYAPEAHQHAVEDLPDEALSYLLGSRYCETDKMSPIAWSLFGHTRPGWERVQSIVDYVHDRITFGYPFARDTRTAAEAFEDRQGVCRDFSHLAITFCRCMNIPARYCTGYLGDIGVPPVDAPMDFSAWFEVYLGGRWYTFDARHNTPRIGRILMARGRDATDVAISTAFGSSRLTGFTVFTDELKPQAGELFITGKGPGEPGPTTVYQSHPAAPVRLAA